MTNYRRIIVAVVAALALFGASAAPAQAASHSTNYQVRATNYVTNYSVNGV